MDLKTAEMVRKAINQELAATFSTGQIAGMTKVNNCGIDDDVYTLVDSDANMFTARLLKKQKGEVDGVWVYKKSLAMTFGISKR